MRYAHPIGRANPALQIFVLDQSSGMATVLSAMPRTTKSETSAQFLDEFIEAICVRCVKAEGILSDRHHLAFIAYNGDAAVIGWPSMVQDKTVASISDMAQSPLFLKKKWVDVETGRGDLIKVQRDIPTWIVPIAQGQAPRKAAFAKARQLVQKWVIEAVSTFPPMVIHITDGGHSNDGDPSSEISQLRALQAADGQPLLVQIVLSSTAEELICPSEESSLPVDLDHSLFKESSLMPDWMLKNAQEWRPQLTATARLLFINPQLVEVLRMLGFGGRPGYMPSITER